MHLGVVQRIWNKKEKGGMNVRPMAYLRKMAGGGKCLPRTCLGEFPGGMSHIHIQYLFDYTHDRARQTAIIWHETPYDYCTELSPLAKMPPGANASHLLLRFVMVRYAYILKRCVVYASSAFCRNVRTPRWSMLFSTRLTTVVPGRLSAVCSRRSSYKHGVVLTGRYLTGSPCSVTVEL